MTRVLVIDDEGSILRALRINLTARKYDVLTAADGASGLAAMARARPDVLILDLGLPDMDGADVIKGVRGQASTPIIVLSAAGQESTKVAALDAGADDYLTKPFGIPGSGGRCPSGTAPASCSPSRPFGAPGDGSPDAVAPVFRERAAQRSGGCCHGRLFSAPGSSCLAGAVGEAVQAAQFGAGRSG